MSCWRNFCHWLNRRLWRFITCANNEENFVKMKFLCPCLGFVGSSTAAGHTTLFTWWLPVSDDVVIWKRFPRYWPFVRVNQRSSLDPPVIGGFHSHRAASSSFDIFSGATRPKAVGQTLEWTVMWSIDDFYCVSLNKLSNKQSSWWWSETP